MTTKLPEKIEPPTMTTTASDIVTICPLNQEAVAINQLIHYLTARQELEDARYKELTSRIDTIAGNQLEMKRGEPCCGNGDFGVLHKYLKEQEQPKRWRAKEGREYYRVDEMGIIGTSYEANDEYDNFRYAIGNYHQTHEQATAYKARLLELGKEI